MLFELVRDTAGVKPDAPLVVEAHATMSYGECRDRAAAIAGGLHAAGITRFGCALDSTAQLVAIVVGASAAGAEVCLYPPALDASGLGRVAERFGHDVVVTDGARAPGGGRWMTPEDLADDSASLPPPPTETPVLILTTGTTGEQKGARHDWRRLVGAVRRPAGHMVRRWLLAYNLNQFAGIQILLHVLANGSTLVVPRSRRADDVIETIADERVTCVSGTPTFWRLIVGSLDPQRAAALPVEQITLGGEAAPEGLLRRIRELFPTARISHVYAGTEFGSVVSVRDGRSGLPLSVLDRAADADVQFKIVEGQLHIRSRVGMLGYHARSDDATEWRPTGDLVEVSGDRILFVGRTTEIINVGGAKVHPLPVEEVVCSVPGVRLAAVYGRPNPITGQIVAVDVVADPEVDADELKHRIRDACESLPAAGRPRRIRFVPELDIRGNKLMRHEQGIAS